MPPKAAGKAAGIASITRTLVEEVRKPGAVVVPGLEVTNLEVFAAAIAITAIDRLARRLKTAATWGLVYNFGERLAGVGPQCRRCQARSLRRLTGVQGSPRRRSRSRCRLSCFLPAPTQNLGYWSMPDSHLPPRGFRSCRNLAY